MLESKTREYSHCLQGIGRVIALGVSNCEQRSEVIYQVKASEIPPKNREREGEEKSRLECLQTFKAGTYVHCMFQTPSYVPHCPRVIILVQTLPQFMPP